MRKLLHITKQEEAFFLPIVLMISILVLSGIMTSIIIYKNELQITEQLVNQIEAETLLQMALEEFSNDEKNRNEKMGQIIYNFPNGDAIVDYELVEEHKYLCIISVITTKNVKLNITANIFVQ